MGFSGKDWPRCACGCGGPVPAREANCTARGYVKGEPCTFVAGHGSRLRSVQVVDGKKRCSKCGTVKLVEGFHRESRRPSGLAAWCKDCVAGKAREWYSRPGNAERTAEAARRFTEANPGARRVAVDRWNLRHRDLHLARARISASAYRARKRGQFVEHVDPGVVFGRDQGVCGICSKDVDPTDFHVDHVIPLARGGEHSYANVQLAHPSCNCRKKDRLQEAVNG